MMLTPARSASRVDSKRCAFPRRPNSPSKWEYTPASTFMSVLFPAPFSPTMACSSPDKISSETRSSASTPGNRTEISRIEMIGGGGDILPAKLPPPNLIDGHGEDDHDA